MRCNHRVVLVLAAVFIFCCVSAVAKDNDPAAPTYPSQQEIRLVLTQAERATDTYEAAIKEEEATMGKDAAPGIGKDREVLSALRTALAALKKNPQGFNSPVSFYFVLWLDDASRNAALCSATATGLAASSVMAQNVAEGYRLLAAGQSCTGASALLYTVSENASEMYGRYLKANDSLMQSAYETVEKCTAALKTK